MDFFLLFGIITISLLILSFIGYSATTNKIIKEQEKEIASLRTIIHRMKNQEVRK